MTETPDIVNLKPLLAFAEKLAHEAGEVTLQYFRQALEIEAKADHSPVTIADRETEAFIRERILAAYPDHAILGEEYGESNPDSPNAAEWRWIVDPIDGTKSFIAGVPLYTVLIALEHQGDAVLGVIHCPAQRETVAAARGLGCFYNGRPCRVSSTAGLEQARVQCSDWGDSLRRFPHLTERLLREALYTRTWADAYGYLLVATGRADVMLDPEMNLWDMAPLKVIIEEAGGRFTDFSGSPSIYGSNALATNGQLHSGLLNLMRA